MSVKKVFDIFKAEQRWWIDEIGPLEDKNMQEISMQNANDSKITISVSVYISDNTPYDSCKASKPILDDLLVIFDRFDVVTS